MDGFVLFAGGERGHLQSSSGGRDQTAVDYVIGPVTFPVRLEANSATSVATLAGVVKRPLRVAPIPATICSRAVAAPVATVLCLREAFLRPAYRSPRIGGGRTVRRQVGC